MQIGAQVSLYPLGQADLLPGIQEVWGALEEAGLEAAPGPLSTLVFGPDQDIFEALRRGFARAVALGPAVMVITITNACPMPGEERPWRSRSTPEPAANH